MQILSGEYTHLGRNVNTIHSYVVHVLFLFVSHPIIPEIKITSSEEGESTPRTGILLSGRLALFVHYLTKLWWKVSLLAKKYFATIYSIISCFNVLRHFPAWIGQMIKEGRAQDATTGLSSCLGCAYIEACGTRKETVYLH